MNKIVILFCVAAIGSLPCVCCAGDPLDDLERAREEFLDASAKFDFQVTNVLDTAEKRARRAGDRAALKALKESRTDFQQLGKMPSSIPERYVRGLQLAKDKLKRKYDFGIRDLTRLGQE